MLPNQKALRGLLSCRVLKMTNATNNWIGMPIAMTKTRKMNNTWELYNGFSIWNGVNWWLDSTVLVGIMSFKMLADAFVTTSCWYSTDIIEIQIITVFESLFLTTDPRNFFGRLPIHCRSERNPELRRRCNLDISFISSLSEEIRTPSDRCSPLCYSDIAASVRNDMNPTGQ